MLKNTCFARRRASSKAFSCQTKPWDLVTILADEQPLVLRSLGQHPEGLALVP